MFCTPFIFLPVDLQFTQFFCSKNSDIVISFCTCVDFDQADDDTARPTTQDDDKTGLGENLSLSLVIMIRDQQRSTISE